MQLWPVTSAAAAHMCAFGLLSKRQRAQRNRTMTMPPIYEEGLLGLNDGDGVLSRRSFFKASVASGSLLLSISVPIGTASSEEHADATFAPNAFLRIDGNGNIVTIIPQVEMGQGTYSSLAVIIAEELDADFSRVSVETAPPNDKLYANPISKYQVAGGSTSMRAFWMAMRKAGASARALLVDAAAAQWKVDPASCRTEKSEVIHDATGQRASYGSLVTAASARTPPQDPPLKKIEDFKLVGQSLKRLDTPSKVNGSAVYGIDAMPDDVKVATLKCSPVSGGKIAHVDDKKTRAIQGVRQIVVLDDMVAVVGDHMWAAKQGLDALDITWDDGPNAHVSTADVWKGLEAASFRNRAVAKSTFSEAKAGGDTIEATYRVPFLAHAPMEPMNCTVHVKRDSCEIWVGNQVITRAQGIAAKVTNLPLEKVIIHNHLIGGGFGRRLEVDGIEKAVRIAQKVDGPLNLGSS